MDTEQEWGKVCMCGGTDWANIGRGKTKNGGSDNDEWPNLASPHLLRDLVDIRVKKIVTGCCSCHSVMLDTKGRVYVMGRNDKGQLGMDDLEVRPYPVSLKTCAKSSAAIGKQKIIKAATGRNHTLLVSSTGLVFGTGDNRFGQLGLDNLRIYTTFVPITTLKKEKIVDVACGADFSLVLTDKGRIFAFGSSEHGQLGNGGSTETPAAPYPQPSLVKGLQEHKITAIACGTSHSLAMSSEGFVFSWGFGGYGRLGHSEQKDLSVATSIPIFASNEYRKATAIACGTTFSMAIDVQKNFHLWGKWKNTGDGSAGKPWMYPRQMIQLNGWAFKGMSGGNVSMFLIPDSDSEVCTIAWGQAAQYGELGYGEDQPRSCTVPTKVAPLDDVRVLDVSCGYGHTLFLVKPDDPKLPDFPKYPELPDVSEFCIKCSRDDNGDKLLVCDKCDAMQHTFCAAPPLDTIPEGDWFCDKCHPPGQQESSDEEERPGEKKKKKGKKTGGEENGTEGEAEKKKRARKSISQKEEGEEEGAGDGEEEDEEKSAKKRGRTSKRSRSAAAS
ncbi:uncharacterized protein VTP21DRAFT_3416 [Calcarisporiella thermophila]|uniref:uncharacterized protein n=1 Tax=Calcarisporiella thermophila TaxID=911321 RepID=UPI003742C25C